MGANLSSLAGNFIGYNDVSNAASDNHVRSLLPSDNGAKLFALPSWLSSVRLGRQNTDEAVMELGTEEEINQVAAVVEKGEEKI